MLWLFLTDQQDMNNNTSSHSLWSRDIKLLESEANNIIELMYGQYSARLKSALKRARQLHSAQLRKGEGDPYIVHPIRVFISITRLNLNDIDLAVAALLHDAIEDCDYNLETLNREFGEKVTTLVKAVTRGSGDGRPSGGDYFDMLYIQSIIQAGDKAIALKLCDKIDNLYDSFYLKDQQKRSQYFKEGETVYRQLANAVKNPKLRNALLQNLDTVLKFRQKPDNLHPEREIVHHLDRSLSATQPGDSIVPPLPLSSVSFIHYTLLNPTLAHGLVHDGVSITKKA